MTIISGATVVLIGILLLVIGFGIGFVTVCSKLVKKFMR